MFMKNLLLVVFLLMTLFSSAQLNYNVTSDTIAFPSAIWVSGQCNVDVFNSTNAPIQLNIVRLEKDLQPDWASAFCTSVDCYLASVDSVSVNVLPGQTEEVIIYFQYIAETSDTARVLVKFSNDQDPSDSFTHNFYGIDSTNVLNLESLENQEEIEVYPNPMTTITTIHFPSDLEGIPVELLDSRGQLQRSYIVEGDKLVVHRDNLAKGVYFISFPSLNHGTKRIVIQ